MNREIKFRAWDIKTKKFRTEIPVVEEWWDSDCWDDGEQAMEHPYIHMNIGNCFKHRLIWQQYTGVNDKNNKEIYEGDLVKVQRSQTFSTETSPGVFNCELEEMGEEIGKVFYGPFDPAFFIEFPSYDDIHQLSSVSHRLEVVGNIFENDNIHNTDEK